MSEGKETKRKKINKIAIFEFNFLDFRKSVAKLWEFFFTTEESRVSVCKWFASLYCRYYRTAPLPYFVA